MNLSTLDEWLAKIATLHPAKIALGLDRVKRVAERLDLLSPQCPVIIVGGTNGKGSTVTGLAAIYLATGYKVGAFTSPVLFKHNEQVQINNQAVSDAAFCATFSAIEKARGDILLTTFEFHTLAALFIFKRETLDVMILEVGLGGRLDAVNIMDANLAIITSIDLDHMEWLGQTREAIGYEKAGIMRAGTPAVCGDPQPPQTIIEQARQIGAPLFCQGRDFIYKAHANSWDWSCEKEKIKYSSLPFNSLLMQNMSTVLMAIHLMQASLPVNQKAIGEGLATATLPGRMQMLEGEALEIHDVSHNPAAITLLAKRLAELPCSGKTYAVFSMLADKDMLASIKAIDEQIDQWHLAPLIDQRAARSEQLLDTFKNAEMNNVMMFTSIEEGYLFSKKIAKAEDRIVVFGSFHTVAEATLNACACINTSCTRK